MKNEDDVYRDSHGNLAFNVTKKEVLLFLHSYKIVLKILSRHDSVKRHNNVLSKFNNATINSGKIVR